MRFNAANTLSFVAGGNAGATKYTSSQRPCINNSAIYEVLYTYAKGNWYIEPYWQYTNVPTNVSVGITKSYEHGWRRAPVQLQFQARNIAGSQARIHNQQRQLGERSLNLLYGPGSNAFSFTVTPTYQKGGFFLRADLGVVDARSFTPGDAFGALGKLKGHKLGAQSEAGFMF